MRLNLGSYGDPVAVTPNVDGLAEGGMLFKRAYCQQPNCNPSRASPLTGRRPDTTEAWELRSHFRSALPKVVTLPQYFKDHSHFAQAIGKICHNYNDTQGPPSWSAPHEVTDRPFFLAVGFLKPHSPYNAPERY